MKLMTFLFVYFSITISCTANAGETLEQDEILNIFNSLRNQIRKSWIPSGTLEGTHINVNLKTEEITTSLEKVGFDGEKFFWTIDIEAFENLEGKPVSNADSRMNTRRIFLWNGREYTLYFKSANNAIVSENAYDMPVNVKGPLKAGIVPWGSGIYDLDELANNLISATRNSDGNVVMTFKDQSLYSMELVLDPAKDYAVISRELDFSGKSVILTTCSDYVRYDKYWIPAKIKCERTLYIDKNTKRYCDFWQITSVDLIIPADNQFTPNYIDNTHIDYRINERTMPYTYKEGRNTEYMLAHRKYNASLADSNDRNCATAAMLYTLAMFGKDINNIDFYGLVRESDKSTSLFEMDEFLKKKGLNTLAVRCDLENLPYLQNSMIILHLPKAQHYVIFDLVEDGYIWLVDLDSDKFYYRIPVSEFIKQWQNQTALIVSDRMIDPPSNSSLISSDELLKIRGSSEGFGTYSCTDLIQEYTTQTCSDFTDICGGKYKTWYNRYTCHSDSNGGYCGGDKLVGSISSDCINDGTGSCTVTGDWISYYMHACN